MQSVLSFHAPEEVSIVEWLSVTPNVQGNRPCAALCAKSGLAAGLNVLRAAQLVVFFLNVWILLEDVTKIFF